MAYYAVHRTGSYNDELTHWKYIDKIKTESGEWRYIYDKNAKKMYPSMSELVNDPMITTKREINFNTDKDGSRITTDKTVSNENSPAHIRNKLAIKSDEAYSKGMNYISKKYFERSISSFSNRQINKGIEYMSKAAGHRIRSIAAKTRATSGKIKGRSTVKKNAYTNDLISFNY